MLLSIICFSNLCCRYQRWLRRARTEDFSHFARLQMVYQSGLFVCLHLYHWYAQIGNYAICYAGRHDWHGGESTCILRCIQGIAAYMVGSIYIFISGHLGEENPCGLARLAWEFHDVIIQLCYWYLVCHCFACFFFPLATWSAQTSLDWML